MSPRYTFPHPKGKYATSVYGAQSSRPQTTPARKIWKTKRRYGHTIGIERKITTKYNNEEQLKNRERNLRGYQSFVKPERWREMGIRISTQAPPTDNIGK